MIKKKILIIICIFILISVIVFTGCKDENIKSVDSIKNTGNSGIVEKPLEENKNEEQEDFSFEFEILDDSFWNINFKDDVVFFNKFEPVYNVDDTWDYDEEKKVWKKDSVTVFDRENNIWALDDGSDWSGNYTIQGLKKVSGRGIFRNKKNVDSFFYNFPENFDFENYFLCCVFYVEPLYWDVSPQGIYIKNIKYECFSKYNSSVQFDIVVDAVPALIKIL